MIFGIIALIVIVLIVLWGVSAYNGLVTLRNRVKNGWAQIDVQLKQRADLIPNLVETVKGYATHEREVFQKVTEARAGVTKAQSVGERAESENLLTGALRTLFAVAENYPELKADTNFLQLQEQLSSLENDIQMSRRYYNGAARDYNIAIATFPAVIIANNFGHKKADYFEADEGERATPKVAF